MMCVDNERVTKYNNVYVLCVVVLVCRCDVASVIVSMNLLLRCIRLL